MPLVGQGEAAGVPEYVRVRLEDGRRHLWRAMIKIVARGEDKEDRAAAA